MYLKKSSANIDNKARFGETECYKHYARKNLLEILEITKELELAILPNKDKESSIMSFHLFKRHSFSILQCKNTIFLLHSCLNST